MSKTLETPLSDRTRRAGHSCASACAQDSQREQRSEQVASRTICLTIDYGDGSQKRFPEIDWSSEQQRTVADALEYARQHARGITVTARGKGETRFLANWLNQASPPWLWNREPTSCGNSDRFNTMRSHVETEVSPGRQDPLS